MSDKRTYQCAHCLGTFEAEWTTEEAEAEAKANWGVERASQRSDMAVICDDCHKKFMAWYRATVDA